MKHLLNGVLFLLISFQLFSQAPNAFSYQAVARNADGSVMAQERVTLKIQILKTSIDSDGRKIPGIETHKMMIEISRADIAQGTYFYSEKSLYWLI